MTFPKLIRQPHDLAKHGRGVGLMTSSLAEFPLSTIRNYNKLAFYSFASAEMYARPATHPRNSSFFLFSLDPQTPERRGNVRWENACMVRFGALDIMFTPLPLCEIRDQPLHPFYTDANLLFLVNLL